jgi:hypothetical protein
MAINTIKIIYVLSLFFEYILASFKVDITLSGIIFLELSFWNYLSGIIFLELSFWNYNEVLLIA